MSRSSSRASRRARPPAGTRSARRAEPAPERIAAFVVTALLFVTPLLVIPTGKEAFRLGQGLAGGWLGLASLLVLSLGLRHARPSLDARAWWGQPAIRALAPLAIIAAAGAWKTRHPAHFHASFADMAIGIACVVGWSVAFSERSMRQLLHWTIPIATIVAVLGIDQFFGWSGALDWLHVEAPTARLRLTSTVGNPGDLASLLVLPLLLALSEWRGADRQTRLALGGAIGVMLAALALTATLSAIAAVMAGCAGWWWLSRVPRDRAAANPRRRLAAALAFAGVVGVAGAIVAAVPPLRTRVAEKIDQLARGDVNALLTGRLDGWRAAWRMLVDAPMTGVGQGAYRAEFADTRLALMAEGVPFLAEQDRVMLATPHNEALSIAAELGVPGLLALGWAIWWLAASAWRGRSETADHDDGRDARALAIAGLVSLGVLATFWFPLHVPSVGWPWLLFLAWVFGRSAHGREPARASAAPAAGPAWLFPLLLAVLVVALGWQTLRTRDRLTASVLLARVESRTVAAVRTGHAPSTLFDQHLAWLDEAARRDPLEVGVPIARGAQFLLLRRPDDALAAYRAAAALEPRPEIDLNIGRALWMKGDRVAARAAFARALTLNPMLRTDVPAEARE